MNTLIDTHCHITCDALYERIDEVLEKCSSSVRILLNMNEQSS